MIFRVNEDLKEFTKTESYKERNFYFKVFAGYLFNELIPDYQTRRQDFFNLLIEKAEKKSFHFGPGIIDDHNLKAILESFSTSEIKLTFDFHASQFAEWKKDRGELADILFISSKYFISTEVKYLTNWNYDKDIKRVQERAHEMEKILGKRAIQVLLVKEVKWLNVNAKNNQEKSQYRLLSNPLKPLKIPLLVLLWEDINKIINDPSVNEFITSQLSRVKSLH